MGEYSKKKQSIHARQAVVRKNKAAMPRKDFDEIEQKFGYRPYYSWYTNRDITKVIALKIGNNEGSGTDFKYGDFVEVWERNNQNQWVLVVSDGALTDIEVIARYDELGSDELAVSLMADEYQSYTARNNTSVKY